MLRQESKSRDRYKYHQDSTKVPKFYTRPGPGLYDTSNIEALSGKDRSQICKFNKSGMLHGIYEDLAPKHRFTDYSRNQLVNNLRQYINKDLDASLVSLEKISFGTVKKMDFLKPNLELTMKDKVKVSFTRSKRPDLFNVQKCHSDPPFYQDQR